MLLDYFQNASSVELSIPMPGHSVGQLGKKYSLRCFDTVFQRAIDITMTTINKKL